MKTLAFIALIAFAAPALAQDSSLNVAVGGIENGARIPEKYAFCTPDAAKHTKDGGNINPQLSWSGAPLGTKSFAVIVVDPDVPTDFSDAGKEGKTLPEAMPRQNFTHWALADIPANRTEIKEGEDSAGMTPGGKAPGKTAYGINGVNDYAKFKMGAGGGYDGPCPPWNDERLHHYHFRVYALDVATLGLSGGFTGTDLEKAMAGHILAQGESVGTYSQFITR